MKCPGCNATVGRFRAAVDTGELVDTIACRITGAKYVLRQDIPTRPPMPGSKKHKRRRGKLPIVIAEESTYAPPRRRQRRPAHGPLRLDA